MTSSPPPERYNRRQALSIWHQVSLESVLSDWPDLSSRQFVILTRIYLIDGTHTVRSLAKDLNVTKAVITRALDTLGGYDFVRRVSDPSDRRSILIQRTPAGTLFLQGFGDLLCRQLRHGSNSGSVKNDG